MPASAGDTEDSFNPWTGLIQETQIQFLRQEDPLEKGSHSSIFSWETPWTEKLGRLQSMGFQSVNISEQLNTHTPMPYYI